MYRALLALALVGAAGVPLADEVEIELVRGGAHLDLPPETQATIAARLPQLFGTCSLNSRRHPREFTTIDVASAWRNTLAGDHLLVRLSDPIVIGANGSSAIRARELLQGLHDPRFPGPELSRDGDQTVGWTKCSGVETIRYVCTPGIRDVMPASYHGLCQFIAE